MNANRGFIVLVLWTAMAALPELAVAQTRSVDLPLRVGQRVRITTDDGSKAEGTVIRLTPASVEIGDGGVTRASLAAADVRRIQMVDSVKNGVVIGAVSLGLVGGLIVTVGVAYGELFESGFTGSSEGTGAGPFLIGAAVGATAGGLLGRAIDGARMKTVYTRPAAGITFHAGPILSTAGRGVGVRVTW